MPSEPTNIAAALTERLRQEIDRQVKYHDMRQEVRTELVDSEIDHRLSKETEAMEALNQDELRVCWHHQISPRRYRDNKIGGTGVNAV